MVHVVSIVLVYSSITLLNVSDVFSMFLLGFMELLVMLVIVRILKIVSKEEINVVVSWIKIAKK